MVRCRLCLIPNSRPDTAFVDGVCSACINFAKRPTIDWATRHAKLLEVLDRADGRVIVPSSGGKDSTYIALRLKELGADVTAVTATTCHLTPIGRANIDNLARHVRTIEVTPNMGVRAKLNRLAFDLVGDPSWPEHVSIHRVPFRVAHDLRVPLLMYGECPNNQYGGPVGTEDTNTMTQRWVAEYGGFLGLRPSDFIGMGGITERDMSDYGSPADDELVSSGTTAYFLGWFEPWDSHRNAQVSIDAGMRFIHPGPMNWWSEENQDNYQTSLHDAAMYRKYGYGRLAAQISVDVRSGRIGRSEALSIVCERDGLFPHSYLDLGIQEICSRIGLSVDEMIACLDRFTNWEFFLHSENGRPILKEFINADSE